MTLYSGRCHCGAIAFSYDTKIRPANWSIRACQCSFCLVHDALSTSDPSGQIRFHAKDGKKLQRYRFGLKTADFLLCPECGVYVGAVIETDRGMWGIINVHAMVGTPTEIAEPLPIDYASEISGERVLRREERWTPATFQ